MPDKEKNSMNSTHNAIATMSSGGSRTARKTSAYARKNFPAFEVSENYEEYLRQTEKADDSDVTKEATDDRRTEPSGEPSLEQQIDAVLTCVGSQNALREVLYKVLLHCAQPRDFSEVEDFISAQDEFVYSHIIQTPYTLIQMLVRCGGLVQTPLDADGVKVSDERTEGLSDEQIDALIASYELATTDAGNAVVGLMSPERRFEAQLAQRPHRSDTFYALLEFCTEPRKFPEIQQFFEDTPGLALDKVQIHHTLSPDFYVDKLDKAGMLVWQGAWVVTDAGRRAIAAHHDSSGSLDE